MKCIICRTNETAAGEDICTKPACEGRAYDRGITDMSHARKSIRYQEEEWRLAHPEDDY